MKKGKKYNWNDMSWWKSQISMAVASILRQGKLEQKFENTIMFYAELTILDRNGFLSVN